MFFFKKNHSYTNPRLSFNQTIPASRYYIFLISIIFILYGFFSRDPWKNEDVVGFSSILFFVKHPIQNWFDVFFKLDYIYGQIFYIYSALIAKVFIIFGMSLAHAIRIGTIILLLFSLLLIWKTTYYIAQKSNISPYMYPLGGHPSIRDYSTCLADISVLLFCSSIGAILRIHETTPFIFGLFCISFLIYSRIIKSIIFSFMALGLILIFNHSLLTFICSTFIIYTYIKDYVNSKLRIIFYVLYSAVSIFLAIKSINFDYVNKDFILQRVNILLSQFPTLTWPLWPFAIFTFIYWIKDSAIKLLFLQILMVMILFLFDKTLHQAYFLYALPSFCILSSIAFTKIGSTVNKGIINFSIIVFSLLLLSLWGIWIAWQTNNNFIYYLNYINHEISKKSIVFAVLFTVAWIFILISMPRFLKKNTIWLPAFIISSGLSISWAVIVYLWLPAVNQIKTYRYVFNTINMYTKNSCVKILNLQEPQLASMSYMGNFKIGNDCPYILDYTPYITEYNQIIPSNYTLIWQGRRILDKNERFYLWKVNHSEI